MLCRLRVGKIDILTTKTIIIPEDDHIHIEMFMPNTLSL